MDNPLKLAFWCDLHGSIEAILLGAANLNPELAVGAPLARLAARGSLGKALSFLEEARTHQFVIGHEINVSAGGEIKTLTFSAGRLDDHLLILGAEDAEFRQKLLDELIRLNNDQTNALRASLKEQTNSTRLYDEISRLNNELVAAQRELAKKNAELGQLNREKNRFLGMAAHDLRNPIFAILSRSQSLLDRAQDPEEQDALQAVVASAEFMTSLLDDLLDVTRIEAGTLHLEWAAVDLVSLVHHAVDFNRPRAARKHLTLTGETPPVGQALTDPGKIEQVLNNLIENAVKFSYPGGAIQVTLRIEPEHFVLSVRDAGVGMSPDQKARLFAPFQRGQPGTAGEKSSGLGLAIVKRIVDGLGGQIQIDSEAGHGTTALVRLPSEPPSQE